MEFIKVGKNYMIKNSNGRIVSEKEKLELENKEIMISPVDCACPDKIKKVSKNKKRIKEIETALKEEVQDDIIKETDKFI